MKINNFDIESFTDSRASRYFDLFPDLTGQITVSFINPFQFSGWHKHDYQTDHFFLARGIIKIGIITPSDQILEKILSDQHPQTIVIPPSHWHAWRSMEKDAILVYHLSRKHDENDEIRATAQMISEKYGYQL